MNMNELKEEELDMVNGGSFWSSLKKAVSKAVTIMVSPIAAATEMVSDALNKTQQ